MRILIAEDGAALREGLAQCLSRADHQVWLAADGEAASGLLRAQAFDLLVLDYGLPRLHGLQVLRELRTRDARLPVLLMSALDDADVGAAQAGLAVDAFLAKPFGLCEFEAMVARLGAARQPTARAVDFGALHCDLASGEITVAGRSLDLPPDERALLTLLVREGGKPVSGAEIARRLDAGHGAPAGIEGCLRRLREHLLPQALGITQLRGLGFSLTRL